MTRHQPVNLGLLFAEQKQIESGGKLHWVHWLIVAASLLLTLVFWYFSKQQIEEKLINQFNRESAEMIELIGERMQKYEDGLWSGVAAIQSNGGQMTHAEWVVFSRNLRIELKYPGINGIGVITYLERGSLGSFLERNRFDRPNFRVHPEHDHRYLLPITYIEPVVPNAKAVGLDVAFEANRRSSALKARDSGEAQISGPIVLVQDAGKTPGFLFYAPYYLEGDKFRYLEGNKFSTAKRRENFVGLVYAPFVMSKLMEGTLQRDKRHVGIQIKDGDQVLYNEHTNDEKDFDPKPLFKKQVKVDVYGREWQFDIWSAKSFRALAENDQPSIILIGGIIIDCLLLAMFMALTRSNRRAMSFANMMADGYRMRSDDLDRSVTELSRTNRDLKHFAYAASHDLQEPLRMVAGSCDFLRVKYADKLDDVGREFIGFAVDGSKRMKQLIDDILLYSDVERDGLPLEPVDLNQVLGDIRVDLKVLIEERGALISAENLSTVRAHRTYIKMALQNLIQNGIKFNKSEQPLIEISSRAENGFEKISVKDNGIGIDPKYRSGIFDIFTQLNTKEDYAGSGIGLSIVRKIAEMHGGIVSIEDMDDQTPGITFTLALPLSDTKKKLRPT